MLSALLALSLAAAEPTGATPYDIDPAPHAVLALTMFAVVGLDNAFVQPTIPGGLACKQVPGTDHCDPSTLNALDRRVVGNHSTAWLRASDISAGIADVGVAAALAIDAST